jgi:hypothetical protein
MNPSLAEHYREILVGVGENPEREGLLDTPKRAAKAMQYLCNGYAMSLEEVIKPTPRWRSPMRRARALVTGLAEFRASTTTKSSPLACILWKLSGINRPCGERTLAGDLAPSALLLQVA